MKTLREVWVATIGPFLDLAVLNSLRHQDSSNSGPDVWVGLMVFGDDIRTSVDIFLRKFLTTSSERPLIQPRLTFTDLNRGVA